MKKFVLLFAALLVAGCGEKSSSERSESLSDADIKQLLKKAADIQIEVDSIEKRNGLFYKVTESQPYSGWAKSIYDSGHVRGLGQCKDGKPEGPSVGWHENGQKQHAIIYKDGEQLSVKYWNSKGEEVETLEEALK